MCIFDPFGCALAHLRLSFTHVSFSQSKKEEKQTLGIDLTRLVHVFHLDSIIFGATRRDARAAQQFVVSLFLRKYVQF